MGCALSFVVLVVCQRFAFVDSEFFLRAAALRSARDKSAKRETRHDEDHQNNQSLANTSRSKSPHQSHVSLQRSTKSPRALLSSKTTIFPPNSGALPTQDKEELKKWMLKVCLCADSDASNTVSSFGFVMTNRTRSHYAFRGASS